ncbi:APC family permease [Thermodesulfobacteriota bacterium]
MVPGPRKKLSLFDSTCIIVGIIIGVGIYETAPIVAASMGSGVGTLIIWLVGGILALAGALCYSELSTAYPQDGGDYVYQSRAYGSWAGYLFGWSQLLVVRPADIALMSFIFARYARILFSPQQNGRLFYAACAVLVLTLINILGVREGKWTQNLLTVIKTLGLIGIIVAGLTAPETLPYQDQPSAITMGGIELALILVLFTFGGWNEMAYVAAEVKKPQLNIIRALLIGTTTVTVLYLLVNGAFLYALGYNRMSTSQAVAVDTIAHIYPGVAAKIIGLLISISALGVINGLIFTGARISYALGAEHKSFQIIGKWNQRLSTPISALVVQGCLSLTIVFLAGSFIDTILYTAPAVWLFFLATGLSVFKLRRKEPETVRPYRVTGHPFTTGIFCASCVFMLYSSISYALSHKPIGLLILAIVLLTGLFLFWVTEGRGR